MMKAHLYTTNGIRVADLELDRESIRRPEVIKYRDRFFIYRTEGGYYEVEVFDADRRSYQSGLYSDARGETPANQLHAQTSHS